MYAGIRDRPKTLQHTTDGKQADKLKGFKLIKRTVHGSVDLRELPPVVTICAAIAKVKDEERTRDKNKIKTHVTKVYGRTVRIKKLKFE